MNNLAAAVENQGRYAEAETLYREVLAVRKRVLGEELAKVLLDEFIAAEFEGGRHQRRVGGDDDEDDYDDDDDDDYEDDDNNDDDDDEADDDDDDGDEDGADGRDDAVDPDEDADASESEGDADHCAICGSGTNLLRCRTKGCTAWCTACLQIAVDRKQPGWTTSAPRKGQWLCGDCASP